MESERYTLSSLLNKMKDVENTFSSFLCNILNSLENDDPLKQVIQTLINSSEKKLKDIEWVKSFVVEMTLEPITGLNISKYLNKMNKIFTDQSFTTHKKFEHLLKTQIELYNKVGDAVEHISVEAAELFRGFSKKLNHILLS